MNKTLTKTHRGMSLGNMYTKPYMAGVKKKSNHLRPSWCFLVIVLKWWWHKYNSKMATWTLAKMLTVSLDFFFHLLIWEIKVTKMELCYYEFKENRFISIHFLHSSQLINDRTLSHDTSKQNNILRYLHSYMIIRKS